MTAKTNVERKLRLPRSRSRVEERKEKGLERFVEINMGRKGGATKFFGPLRGHYCARHGSQLIFKVFKA